MEIFIGSVKLVMPPPPHTQTRVASAPGRVKTGFLDLPGELRNKIYKEYVPSDDTVHDIIFEQYRPDWDHVHPLIAKEINSIYGQVQSLRNVVFDARCISLAQAVVRWQQWQAGLSPRSAKEVEVLHFKFPKYTMRFDLIYEALYPCCSNLPGCPNMVLRVSSELRLEPGAVDWVNKSCDTQSVEHAINKVLRLSRVALSDRECMDIAINALGRWAFRQNCVLHCFQLFGPSILRQILQDAFSFDTIDAHMRRCETCAIPGVGGL